MNDVVLNKVTTIERCMHGIIEVYEDNPSNLKDFTKQDSIILNIQRACEASIDLAMHIISERKLGLPKTSREGFKILQNAKIIDRHLATSLMNILEFRKIAIRNCQDLNIHTLQMIIEKHLDNFKQFSKIILQLEE